MTETANIESQGSTESRPTGADGVQTSERDAGGNPRGPQPALPGPGKRAGMSEHFAFKAHPLLPMPSAEQMAEDLKTPAGQEQLQKFLNARAERLQQAAADPLQHSLRLPDSRRVDELLCDPSVQLLYESGGKRAGKTEDGVPRFLRCCFKYGKAQRWAMQDNAISSVANLQQKFWDYLPENIKALNMKRDRTGKAKYRVHYTKDNGFDGLLVLPNECAIYFLNYTQNPSDFLGWELGKSLEVPLEPGVPDIGALLDENCPFAWLENIQLRCSTRSAKIHWMYSPQDGITPTIKDLKSNAKTVESAPAELLSERVNVPGLPKGHMPLVQRDEKKRLAIFYRFTKHNPFSGYANPGGVRELCQGKNDLAYTMAHAYGYCEAVRGRACPLFGEWNIVEPEEVPADGTNYMVTDPAGARNWFTLWARVAPGNPMEIFIYREWPDFDTYGDWAVTSKAKAKLNGERGPAQPTVGYGPAQYKNLFLRLERIHVPKTIIERAKLNDEITPAEWDVLSQPVADLHHRRVIRRAVFGSRMEDLEPLGIEELEHLQEPIFERLIDPRAATNSTAAERKGVDLIAKLQQESRDERSNEVIAAPMYFVPAPGLDLRDGISQINELLFFNQHEERIRLLNAPRLLVSKRCRNLIWALNNYSLPDDESTGDDACEDPVDDLRYLITRGPRYVLQGGKVKTRGGGGY